MYVTYDDVEMARAELVDHVGDVVRVTTLVGECQDYVIVGLDGLEVVVTRWPERARICRLRLDEIVQVHIY